MSTRFRISLLSWRDRFASLIGNFLEHYDNALFSLLAPFIAPLFFEKEDPLTALILTYGMLPLGCLMKPLGSLCFGIIGDRVGRREALFLSLSGMAIVTVCMGMLPLYQDVGIYAPLLLASGRMFQSFFAAGESVGGAIFLLEETEGAKRGLVSSLYNVSTMGGILFASSVVTWMSSQGSIEENWRILFWAGGATALFGVILRLKSRTELIKEVTIQKESIFSLLRRNKKALLSIIIASGFSYTTYAMAFTFMNGYLPLITSLSNGEVISMNTSLLVIDMLLLPIFGYLATRLGKERVMFFGALLSVLGAVPLFMLLDHASIGMIIFVRIGIIISGVAFAAPYNAWAMEQIPLSHRYLILSLGTSIGSQLIGAPTSAISLWLYQATQWSAIPGVYQMAVALGASFMIYQSARFKTPLESEEGG